MAHALSAGCAVVLQRGFAVEDAQALDCLEQSGGQRARDHIALWRDQGENFLVYAITSTGIHTAFETSRRALMAERIAQITRVSAARHAQCHMSLQVEEDMRELLGSILDTHEAELTLSKVHEDAQEPAAITVQRPVASATAEERLLVAHIPRETVEAFDVSSFLMVLDSLANSRDALVKNWMRLRLHFAGWAEEGGPADHQNPAIRSFLRSAMEMAPWWMALAHPAEYVKWFGCVADAKPMPSRTTHTPYKFRPDAVRPFSGIGVLEAEILLDCSGIESGETREHMVEALNMMAANLVVGVDLIKLDAERSAIKRLGLRSA